MGRAYRRCKVPLVSAPLDLGGDVVELLRALIDIESVSGDETEIADRVEQALRRYDHLEVSRDGNVVIARTELGRSERVVIAGHLDTVPIAGNVPSWTTHDSAGREIIWGRGACDMKGGVAVQLSVAAALARPRRDVTWVFYDNEEVEEYRNGLARIAREHPDYLPVRLRGALRTNQRAHRGRLPRDHAAAAGAARSGRTLGPFLDGAQRHSRCGRRAATVWLRTSRSRSRSTG